MAKTRAAVMKAFKEKFGIPFVKTTEEFGTGKGGIWTTGEEGPKDGGLPWFNYYAYGEGWAGSYESGVRRDVAKYLEKVGWYVEWYDPGTVMVYSNDF